MPSGGNTGGGGGTTYTAGNGISISGSSISVSNPPNFLADGRLTLTTAVPVTTADVSGAGTLYYTPYIGDRISLYDGTNWVPNTFSELSLALSVTSGKNYDAFVWNNGGTLTLALGTAWTNDTTRANALVRQNGVWVNNVAEGSMAQYRGRYVGTIRASGSNTTEDSGLYRGSQIEGKRYVWNMYNRVKRAFRIVDTTNSWTYNSLTVRPWNNNTGNRCSFVIGLGEDPVRLEFWVETVSSAGAYSIPGICLDNTNANSQHVETPAASTQPSLAGALYEDFPGIGYHFLQLVESAGTSITNTWYGDAAVTGVQSGAFGYMWG